MAEAKSIARAKDGCRISYRIYANPGKPRLTLIHSLALSGGDVERSREGALRECGNSHL
jgi:hypothetical protein